jgi:hypothetical protein
MKREEFHIYEFHQELQSKIQHHDIKKINCMEEKLSSPMSYVEELKLNKDIHEAKHQMNIESSFREFTSQVFPLVEEYNNLLNCTIKDSFLKKKRQTPIDIQHKKSALVNQFIQCIENYPALAFYLPSFKDERSHQRFCDDCQVELESYEHHLICPKCYQEQPILCNDEVVSFKDLSRINTNVKYSYIRQTHFKDTMKQFQGKQNKYIDESIFDTLRSCFDQSGLNKKNDQGYYTMITKDHIKMFLQENSLYKYYEDINLIYWKLTGVPCPNISSYEKTLLSDFENLLNVYDRVIKEDCNYSRTNFLNSYYVLYQLLKKNAFPCKETDFPIIKTIDRKLEHDEIYEKCCIILGWIFYATV